MRNKLTETQERVNRSCTSTLIGNIPKSSFLYQPWIKSNLLEADVRYHPEILWFRNLPYYTAKQEIKILWDLQKQLADLKLKFRKMEQENARLESSVVRLETQVKRYKSQAEQAENIEDKLIGEKRRIARELRQAQERIMAVETENEHLQKRLDKLKQRRKEEL